MREMLRGKRARVATVAALAVALAAGVTLGATLREGGSGATAQTATTPTTALPANPPTCTAKTLGVSRASNPGLAADCDTLLAIKSTLRVSGRINYDTPLWRDHHFAFDWSAPSPIRYWSAVTLGGTPLRVTGLDFSDTREHMLVYNARTRMREPSQPYTREWTLRGVVPTQLGQLTALETLDFGDSELTGVVPTQLGALTKLTRLDLGDNRLTGAIPTQLGSLTALTSLDLSDNSLTGAIPTGLGSLTALTSLDLSDNSLSGSVPTWLASLTKLTSLDLSDNSLTGGIPAGLRNLPPTLATLRLAGNALTGCVDERLRLAATNDLATLMKVRSLSWCPVALLPDDGALTPGTTYQMSSDTIIIDIPATGPRIQLFSLVAWESFEKGGLSFCFSDLNDLELVCLEGSTGKEWSRGSIDARLRQLNESGPAETGASTASTPPTGLESIFDALVASARRAP